MYPNKRDVKIQQFITVIYRAVVHLFLKYADYFSDVIKCSSSEFRCDFGDKCINNSLICDGNVQCRDFTDELNCGKITLEI